MGKNYTIERVPDRRYKSGFKEIAVMKTAPEDSKENEDWIQKVRALRKAKKN